MFTPATELHLPKMLTDIYFPFEDLKVFYK